MKTWLLRLFHKKIISLDGSPYLTRYTIFRCPLFGVFLHHIHRSDSDRSLHDHPWSFVSVILKGGYTEELRLRPGHHEVGWRGPGSILVRPAKAAHRVTMNSPTWSLVLVGRRSRDWGYHTESGWVSAGD